MAEDEKMIIHTHEDMNISYVKTEKGLWQSTFNPEINDIIKIEPVPFPNFQLTVAGISYGSFSAQNTGYTNLPAIMEMENAEKDKDCIDFTYRHEMTGLKVVVHMEMVPGVNIMRQNSTIINEGNEPVVITHLSSMCMNGIATSGIRPWYDTDKIKVHYCIQAWQGEGQWRNAGLEELGLYPTSVHPAYNAIHFSSIGSWSTGRYLPMVVIEDTETAQVWYFQIETSTNWHIEIGHRGSWGDESGALFIHADGADERFGGWNKKLMPGESFNSVPVAVGCCKGNFNEAVKELTKYRRTLTRKNPPVISCPVVFNDYMNTLWGNPTREKLLPLIDAAAMAGAEYYCIDAGWHGEINVSWGYGLGDWKPSTTRFGQEGLKGMLEYIQSKGMIPGLWTELEVCGEGSELAKKPDEWFLMRNGARVGGPDRWLLDLNNQDVRKYLHNVVDYLVDMGMGYIKNDYNICIGNGCDSPGNSYADGLITHISALYSFIDEVKAKHPNLIIENVGSGGMRQDYGILSRSHIQSITDQEIYYNYPSILTGTLAAVLPEQLGIWVYPYPMLFKQMNHPEIFASEEHKASMADGEQTIFNMVNGLCGNICLCGCLNETDSLNMNLIKEAITLYKKERTHIQNSYVSWPIGFTRMNVKNSWAAVGLSNENNTRVLLAVWRLGSVEEYKELTLHGWAGQNAVIRQLFPAKNYDKKFYYNKRKGKLTVHLTKMFQARYFEITSH